MLRACVAAFRFCLLFGRRSINCTEADFGMCCHSVFLVTLCVLLVMDDLNSLKRFFEAVDVRTRQKHGLSIEIIDKMTNPLTIVRHFANLCSHATHSCVQMRWK